MKTNLSKFEEEQNIRKFSCNIQLFTLRPVEVDGVNDIAAIVCSSGTTGLSKGMKSHSNL